METEKQIGLKSESVFFRFLLHIFMTEKHQKAVDCCWYGLVVAQRSRVPFSRRSVLDLFLFNTSINNFLRRNHKRYSQFCRWQSQSLYSKWSSHIRVKSGSARWHFLTSVPKINCELKDQRDCSIMVTISFGHHL